MIQALRSKELLPEEKSKKFWSAFGQALRAEPRDYLSIRGSSGFDHSVEAIFVDDKGKRVILVSAEPNPRIAALMRVDIQAAIAGSQILIARPITFDIASFARKVVRQLGQVEFPLNDLTDMMKAVEERKDDPNAVKAFKDWFRPFGFTFENITLPALNQILAGIQQLALLDWQSIVKWKVSLRSNDFS